MEPRPLPKAPITEAVLEIQVKPRPDLNVAELERLTSSIMPGDAEVRRLNAVEGSFNFGKTKPVVADIEEQLIGFQFWARDKKYVTTCRKDRFSFTRLSPYTAWEDTFTKFREKWPIYVALAKPEGITRVAVRYINRIALPAAGLDFNDFLTAGPNLPESFPQRVSSFLTRVVVHEPEEGLAAVITHSLEGQHGPDSVSVLLDIDAYKIASYALDDASVWAAFQLLRTMKNKIFFASITEKALNLFL